MGLVVLGVEFFLIVSVVALPLLLLHKKPPPEAYKSPGVPKLALKSVLILANSILAKFNVYKKVFSS